MIHLKRLLWLLTWGVWLWLGFGLHRELPRELAIESLALPFGDSDHPLGFIDGGERVVTEVVELGEQLHYSVWEVDAARKIHDLIGPPIWNGGRVSTRHGVAIGLSKGKDDGAAERSMQALDLGSGQWRLLGPSSWVVVGVHPQRPWVAFADKAPADRSPGRWFARSKLLVVDLTTGERVFEWTDPHVDDRGPRISNCQFTDDDGLYVYSDRIVNHQLHAYSWEIVSLSMSRGECARMARNRGRSVARLPVRGGRVVVFGQDRDAWFVEVVEFPSGRTVFSSERIPAPLDDAAKNEWKSSPTLAANGRTLFSGHGRLWSVDHNRLIWPCSNAEHRGNRGPIADSFLVYEEWGAWLWDRDIAAGLRTTAVRDMNGGAIRYRYRGSVEFDFVTDDGLRAMTANGVILNMPPRVNWPLLALCQTILAMPLVLLWALLRWRRKRQLRLASVTP